MVWALLAVLGVPIWLIVGALGAVVFSRRHFMAQPGVFRLKMRQTDQEKWPRGFAHGRAVHDVLIVNVGPALLRTEVWPVQSVEDHPGDNSIAGIDQLAVHKLVFDDGSSALIAVDRSSASKIDSLRRSESL